MTDRDSRNHPLFWVPDAKFQRFDEWSLPKCFAFGDMDILEECNFGDISDNYFRCGEVLIEKIYSNGVEDFVAQFPTIYLFRHAFEMRLKQIIQIQTGKIAKFDHEILDLMNKITGLDEWARNRLQELHEIDPRSTRLRYGGVGRNARDYLGTDVGFFHEAMRALRDYLAAFSAVQNGMATS